MKSAMSFLAQLFLPFMMLLGCIAAVHHNIINSDLIHKDTVSENGELISPATKYVQEFLYGVDVGLGTFQGPSPSFKSYTLQVDSGSELTWIQCEGCKTDGHQCFNQTEPVYPNSQSKSYKPLHQSNTFNLTLGQGSYASGTLARETFTFKTRNGKVVAVPNVEFGCSSDSRNIKYVLATRTFSNPISGALSLGWGPRSFLSQIDSVSHGKFSYCVKPNTTKTSYLKFGRDVTPPKYPQTTAIREIKPSPSYYVNLQALSVNGKRLNIKPTDLVGANGGCAFDSGTLFSLFKPSVLDTIYAALEKELAKNKLVKKVVVHRGFKDLCYILLSPEGRKHLPEMTFHLENADLQVNTEALFLFAVVNEDISKEIPRGSVTFCLSLLPSPQKTAIGAYQQNGQKVVYDTRAKQLSFGPEDCDESS